MRKELEEKALALTRELLKRFWQLDIEFVLSLCTKDVMWVAPEQNRYMRGIDAMRADLEENLKELVPCHQSHQEYTVVQNCGRALSIIGRYLVTTDDGAPIFAEVQQRTQITWELIDGELRIRSLYISHPRNELPVAPGEFFCNVIGRAAKRYIDERIAEKTDLRREMIYDREGTMHLVAPMDVILVEAVGKRARICLAYDTFEARTSFSEVTAIFPDLIRVHRSYAVNLARIHAVDQASIIMEGDEAVPLPKARRAEVMQRIRALADGELD
jgi:hypothetical protein